MTSTNKTPNHDKPPRKNQSNLQHSAQDKAQAVLAVWTERCKPAEVCRQLRITWITLHYWQRRAMEGMLQALESRVNLARGEALSPRLQGLLQSHQRQQNLTRLSGRLKQIQQKKIASGPSEPPKTS
jgi:transposase-like protein